MMLKTIDHCVIITLDIIYLFLCTRTLIPRYKQFFFFIIIGISIRDLSSYTVHVQKLNYNVVSSS